MKTRVFLFIALILFFSKFLFLPVLGWHTAIDFFAVFILTLAVADRSFKAKFLLTFAVVIFFDIFSGGVFGSLSLALGGSILLVFSAKKFLLASEQNYFLSFLVILLCYQFYILVLFRLERLNWTFNFFNLFILSIFILFFIYAVVAKQKRISGI